MSATTGAASTGDYTVASFSLEASAGVPALINSFDGVLCLPPPQESCFSGVPELIFPGLTHSGTTIWTDTSSPNFAVIVNELTNGEPGLISWSLEAPITGVGVGIVAVTERDLLGDQVGPSGVDLAGYTIDRIGLRADSLSFDSPGSDPNGDGIWTDFAVRATFLFEGRIASEDVCKNGGWRSLHSPDGRFHNQGQCIRLFNSGGQ